MNETRRLQRENTALRKALLAFVRCEAGIAQDARNPRSRKWLMERAAKALATRKAKPVSEQAE